MCVALLVGLGYHHLSMNGKNIPRVKYLLRHLDYEEAQKLSQQGVMAHTATEVRHLVSAFMERRGRRTDSRRTLTVYISAEIRKAAVL